VQALHGAVTKLRRGIARAQHASLAT